jgi:hypothetical protein
MKNLSELKDLSSDNNNEFKRKKEDLTYQKKSLEEDLEKTRKEKDYMIGKQH